MPLRYLPECSTPDFVGGYSVGFQGTASETSVSLTSLTGGLASAPAENDIVIVFYATGAASGVDLDMYITGYTEALDEFNPYGSGGSANYGIWWKRMTATPDTSVTVSKTANTANPGIVIVHVWRGQDLTTPFCAGPLTFNDSSITGVPNPPQIYSPYRGAVILCMGTGHGSYLDDMTFSAGYLSNFFERVETDTSRVSLGVGSVVALGGNYNPAAWTVSEQAYYPSAATIALKGA